MWQRQCLNLVSPIAMAINIRNREAEALLAELKAATGKGATQIVLELLRREVAFQRRLGNDAVQEKRIDDISRTARAKAVNTDLTDEEIIGYDDDGLPN